MRVRKYIQAHWAARHEADAGAELAHAADDVTRTPFIAARLVAVSD